MPLPADVELLPAAREQEPTLANLLQLCAHDFSEFTDLTIGPDGRYPYSRLSLYWLEANRFPFLVKVDGHLAGFVLVSRGSLVSGNPLVWDMAEFFIMRKYRRRKVGAAVAQEVWRRFCGSWEVRVLETNLTALRFWEATIVAFTGAKARAASLMEGGKQRRIFSFESSGAGEPR